MANELIVVRQLPIIEDQLREVKASIEQRVAATLSLVCTEDTYKEIKRERAALAKEYKALEDKRKEVKKAILTPYENFEALYKACAGDIYADADRKLKERIAEVEDGIKKGKYDAVSAFFDEYRISKGIDAGLVSFDSSGIKITMSDSVKSLRDQCSIYLERISDDLGMIDTMDNKDEILVEYKKSLNVSQAVTAVAARHKAIEEEQRRREEQAAARKAAAEAQQAVEKIVEETIQPPQAAPLPEAEQISAPDVEEKQFQTAFRVTASLEKLRALKTFLTEGGYTYEQLR